MIIITGATKSGKTFFIKKTLLRGKINYKYISTQDIKSYYFRQGHIIDTPCIKNNNIDLVFEHIKKICIDKIDAIILFNSHTLENKNISKINDYCKSKEINFILYKNNNDLNYGDINFNIIENKEELESYCRKIITKSIKPDKSFIVVGLTNVGKTSLINQLVNCNIFKTENARHTTKETLKLFYNSDNKNIAIYDTYGLEHKTQGKIIALKKLLYEVDRVFIVTDVTNYNRKINRFIYNAIKKIEVNISLIVNKYDIIHNSYTDSNIRKNIITRENINEYINHKFNNISINYTSTQINHLSLYNVFYKYLQIEKPYVNCKKLTIKLKEKFKDIVFIKEIKENRKIFEFLIVTNNNPNAEFKTERIKNEISRFAYIEDFCIKLNFKKGQEKQKILLC
ncbi:GTPase Era [bacterium AB1]|nr:GTPase Era [bacterium AB1]